MVLIKNFINNSWSTVYSKITYVTYNWSATWKKISPKERVLDQLLLTIRKFLFIAELETDAGPFSLCKQSLKSGGSSHVQNRFSPS